MLLLQQVLQITPSLLLWFWLLASGAVIVTLLPVPLPNAFKDAVRLSAARGKLWSTRPQSLGALNDLSVPQSWFLHFYAIGTACCVALLAVVSASRLMDTTAGQTVTLQGDCTYLALCLFTLHLVRRLLETACMMVYPATARMHVIAYLFGCVYYAVAPLSLMPHSFWAATNKPESLLYWLQPAAGVGRWQVLERGLLGSVGEVWRVVEGMLEVGAWLPLMGGVVFLLGFWLQFHSHWGLALIASTAPAPSPKHPPNKRPYEGYVIPRGGMFELVSCPHYLGEMVIYLGLALLCWPASKPLLMLVWVVVNLVLAADATQKWYLSRFPMYPKQRRALIPFLF